MHNLPAGSQAEWPAHNSETRSWRASGRGPKADRMLTQIDVSIPPFIASESYTPGRSTSAALETATQSIIGLDLGSGQRLKSLAQFLMRTESVSSSKIEYVEADADDYARALAGIKSNESAVSMVAATNAIQQMI